MIETGVDYTVQLAGTPPGNMRFLLHADVGSMKLKIPYPNAGAYAVYVGGEEIAMTPWDEAAGRNAALTKTKGCGENRFVGIENFLEFFITPGCEVTIKPKDAIMTSVRMEWTLEAFYGDGGVVSFADRVAAALGIHASTVKIVAVYEGSVIVDYFIEVEPEEDEEEEVAEARLAAIKTNLYTQLASGTISLGAPVLGAITAGDIVMPTPENTVMTTSSGTNNAN